MYYSDKPIESCEADQLGRAQFSKNLAKSLLNLKSSETFTVGLYGKWGSGKTSVLNMIQQEIEHLSTEMKDSEVPLIMRFEPWNYSDCNQLLVQFFAQLSSIIDLKSKDKNLEKVGKLLEQYSSSLSLLEYIPYFGKFLKIIPALAEDVGHNLKESSEMRISDISLQKEAVVKALEKQTRRIIVFVDDIDRLSNEQIRLIFKLTQSIASFPSMIYILAFDQEVVANALSPVQNCDGSKYLEKIIQVPFYLPEIDSSKIRKVLFSRLYDLIKKYEINNFDTLYLSKVFRFCVAPYIHTMRDIIRVINVLSLKLALLGNEVNFSDLVAVCVFQTLVPQYMTYIKANKTALIGSNDPFEMLRERHKDKKSKEEFTKEFSTITSISPEKMVDSLSILFPKFASQIKHNNEYYTDDDLRREKRLAHIDKYDLYMTLSLDELAVTNSELEKIINILEENEFVEYLYESDSQNRVIDLLLELQSHIDRIPIERIPLFVRVLIEQAYNLSETNQKTFFQISAKDCAEQFIYKLLFRLTDEAERGLLLLEILESCSVKGLQTFSTLLYKFELEHGRLAAKGNEKSKKTVSIESLEALESCFLKKIHSLFKDGENNVLDQPNAFMLCYLWENFDNVSFYAVLEKLLESPKNICRCMSLSASKWTGTSISWSFSEDYLKYVSKEKVFESIDKTVFSSEYNSLPDELKETMAAFIIWNNNPDVDEDERVTLPKVSELLLEWENIRTSLDI